MLYSIRNLKKSYGDRVVLDLPELFLEEGTIYGLLGPNGSGKSTLLSILSFLSAPSTGTVFYNDKPVSYTGNALQHLRREVVLVDQHPILFSTSVYRNVAYGPKIRKVPEAKLRRIVNEALDRVGMRDFADAPADRLSGGETQRVAIARALACRPKVLFFDEPTASVDVSSQIAIENIIGDLHADGGISIVISTHNLLQAAKLARKKVFLFEGRASASTYENIFTGEAVIHSGKPYCRIEKNLLIPIKKRTSGHLRITINPKSVHIVPASSSAGGPGVFEGTVFQITAERGSFVRVVVDIGVPLSALVRKKESKRQEIGIGDTVCIRCGDHGVAVI